MDNFVLSMVRAEKCEVAHNGHRKTDGHGWVMRNLAFAGGGGEYGPLPFLRHKQTDCPPLCTIPAGLSYNPRCGRHGTAAAGDRPGSEGAVGPLPVRRQDLGPIGLRAAADIRSATALPAYLAPPLRADGSQTHRWSKPDSNSRSHLRRYRCEAQE